MTFGRQVWANISSTQLNVPLTILRATLDDGRLSLEMFNGD